MHAQFKSFLSLAAAVLVGLSLSACSGKPDGMDEAKQIAENDLPYKEAFAVDNLVRENGWENGNTYNVRFNYNIVPKKDYDQTWLTCLEATLNEPDVKGKTAEQFFAAAGGGGFGGLVGAFQEMSASLGSSQYRSFFRNSHPTVEKAVVALEQKYNNKAMPAVFVMAIGNQFERIGYTDSMAAGAKIPRTVTITYFKTEKGWVKSQ